MGEDRFEQLLRRMPEIAQAVNSFQSEAMQRLAFQSLMEAWGFTVDDRQTQPAPAGTISAQAASSAKAQPAAASPLRTEDILAMARARVPKAKTDPTSQGHADSTSTGASATPSAKPATKEAEPPSGVELIKLESRLLRGTIAQELAQDTDHFEKDTTQLLKFHGSYQQDNRDERSKTSGTKSQKSYMLMVRTKIPGGRLTSEQLLAELDLCDEVGNTTLRITSRQGLQLHGVSKRDLQKTVRRINEIQLTTFGACGDVERNVTCCPGPYANPMYQTVQDLAVQISRHFTPATRSYSEIWMADPNGQNKQLVSGNAEGEQEQEPIYSTRYLPRKFKTAIAFPHDNCIDVYTNDLGLLAIVREDAIIGYNVLVGGGMGVSPSAKKTFPALAHRMAFVTPAQVLDVATAVVKVQRDFGNRNDRKLARLKYLIHDWGIEAFRAKVEEYYGKRLADVEPDEVHGVNDHMGWEPQGDGRWFYGLNVENGRIKDDDHMRLKSALREICDKFRPGIRLTANQSMLFTDLEESNKAALEEILRRHHVPLTEDVSTVRRWSMACVAWPTCGLSITEAERALPGINDQLEKVLAKLGLESDKLAVRMTGCPNGCARPYNSDIGLVGKAAGKYTVFVGGRLLGDRLNFIYKDLVPEEELIDTLMPLFIYYRQERQKGESFGDFCHHKGQADLLAFAENCPASV